MTNVDDLVKGWANHFFSADKSITWLHSEKEVELKLDGHTILMGRLDALGEAPGGELFFGEWKTANPREKKTWKQVWRMNPQSLTYGVLARSLYPNCERFTVRKAFKELNGLPTYDHAWFRYSQTELDNWTLELINIAEEIRTYRLLDEVNFRGLKSWPVNYQHCYQFGTNYACPWFEPACSKGDPTGKPDNSLVRISHLDAERRLNEAGKEPHLVVLDATRVKTWLACRERYRREYEENDAVPPGEALQVGIEFHEQLAKYYGALVPQEVLKGE